MTNSLLVPFLNKDPVYCHGVEFGMQIMAKMLNEEPEISGYFRTENEEQIRLACHRMGYSIEELKPWRFKKKYTGWVWMFLVRRGKSIEFETAER